VIEGRNRRKKERKRSKGKQGRTEEREREKKQKQNKPEREKPQGDETKTETGGRTIKTEGEKENRGLSLYTGKKKNNHHHSNHHCFFTATSNHCQRQWPRSFTPGNLLSLSGLSCWFVSFACRTWAIHVLLVSPFLLKTSTSIYFMVFVMSLKTW